MKQALLGFSEKYPKSQWPTYQELYSLLPIFPVTALCYLGLKNRTVFSFFFFFNQEKTRCIWSSKATLSERAIQNVVESKCLPFKATGIPSLASLRYSRNSCSEGWLRSCLENQLAEEVWASEECHSSIERFGKHFYFCVSCKKTYSVLHH